MSGGYHDLDIYRRAHALAVEIHKMTLVLPKHEMYEEGGQIRRSSKSVAAQIVEGYCLRKNKNEFVQYLNRAFASCNESLEHLELLRETGSLNDVALYGRLHSDLQALAKMIFRFMESVMGGHEKPSFVRESDAAYQHDSASSSWGQDWQEAADNEAPTSNIKHPTSR